MRILIFLGLLFGFCFSNAQYRVSFEPNYDESKVPVFEVPDPLRTFKGRKVKNPKVWTEKRRPELLQFFTTNVYGKVPGEFKMVRWDIVEQADDAVDGKATRKQVDILFEKDNREFHFNILMYLPRSSKPSPVFLGYNFYGNHTVINDVSVIISDAWVSNNPSFGIINNQLTEQSRGVRNNRWAIEKIIDAGYGLATIYYGEIDPDKDDFSDGVHPFFYENGQDRPEFDEWGSIAAWAWGLSRAMDYFQNDEDIDASKVIVFGHSRLGKTSLWAGATDERFAGVISNNSGCGGAALSKRKFGETVARINHSFPHWFCRNFRNYNNNEEALPVDQHELIALIAPRPVYIASAEEDKWADPKGEFLSALYATPVYNLFGKKGIQSEEMPAVNQPVQNTVAYHIRSGVHDVTDYDWEQYILWADRQVLNK